MSPAGSPKFDSVAPNLWDGKKSCLPATVDSSKTTTP
jgi:hypothetical protein